MRNYSTLPSLLLLQQHNSGLTRNPGPDPRMSLQMCSDVNVSLHSEGLERNEADLNHPGSTFSSGFSYLTSAVPHVPPTMNSFVPPMMNQCSTSNVEEDTHSHFGQPFQSDLLRDSRKRPLEDFVPRDGLFSMISNTPFPVETPVFKSKAIGKPMNAHVLKVAQSFKAPAARSQKLSDKITSLQKVVSPYGKTDTASVLQEACTYIKIAHQEIRRLSVSYFGARPIRPQVHRDPEKWYPDLRSKGLSLVPLSTTSRFSAEDSDDGSNSNQGVSKVINSWGF